MAAVNEMRLPDFSVCLQAQAGIMPLKGKCIPRVQRVVLIGCLYASLHSGFVRLTACILAGSKGGSPSNIAPFQGKGVFGKDAEIRTHQALHEAKSTECPKGDRD